MMLASRRKAKKAKEELEEVEMAEELYVKCVRPVLQPEMLQ